MWLNGLLSVGDEELAIVIEETVESLKNLSGSQIELIKNNPVTMTNSGCETTVDESQLPVLVRNIVTEILLDFGAFVVVDTDKLMAGHFG